MSQIHKNKSIATKILSVASVSSLGIFLTLLGACGPQANRLHLNDQEAALHTTGTLSGKATKVDSAPLAPQDIQYTPSGVSIVPSPQDLEVSFFSYNDVLVKANFDAQIIEVSFDLVINALPEAPKYSIQLEGAIETEGINRGFANLRPISAKNQDGAEIALPPLVAQARCIEDCESAVVDIISKTSDGNLQTHQYQIESPIRIREGKEVLPQDKPSQSQEASTIVDDEQALMDFEFDDAGFDSVPGAYAPPVIQSSISAEIQTDVSSYLSEQLSPEKKAKIQKQPKATTSPSTFNQVVVHNPEKDRETLFPLELGSEFSGKAFNFYHSYCEINQSNGSKIFKSVRVDSKNNICQKNNRDIISGGVSIASALPSKDLGFISATHSRTKERFYGSGLLVKYLVETGKAFNQKFKDTSFIVNDISQLDGGPVWSTPSKLAHASHQNGLDADISTVRNSKEEFQTKENWELLKVLNGLGFVHMIYTGANNIEAVCKYAKNLMSENGKSEYENYLNIFKRLRSWDGHKTHWHLRLKCTAHNPSCREDRADPLLGKPAC